MQGIKLVKYNCAVELTEYLFKKKEKPWAILMSDLNRDLLADIC